MLLSSTCVLLYALPSFERCYPCNFVMCVVTSTSLQSGAFVNVDFRDLAISLSPRTVFINMSYVHVVS